MSPTVHVALDRWGDISKVEVYLTVETVWRGQPATLTLVGDRYQTTSGLSDWRVIGRHARDGDGHNLTETARRRLHDRHQAELCDWLDTHAYHVALVDGIYAALVAAGAALTGSTDNDHYRRIVERQQETLVNGDGPVKLSIERLVALARIAHHHQAWRDAIDDAGQRTARAPEGAAA